VKTSVALTTTPVADKEMFDGIVRATVMTPVSSFCVKLLITVRFCGLVAAVTCKSAILLNISSKASSTVVEVMSPGASAVIVFYKLNCLFTLIDQSLARQGFCLIFSNAKTYRTLRFHKFLGVDKML
jgi:hypothetical protein